MKKATLHHWIFVPQISQLIKALLSNYWNTHMHGCMHTYTHMHEHKCDGLNSREKTLLVVTYGTSVVRLGHWGYSHLCFINSPGSKIYIFLTKKLK